MLVSSQPTADTTSVPATHEIRGCCYFGTAIRLCGRCTALRHGGRCRLLRIVLERSVCLDCWGQHHSGETIPANGRTQSDDKLVNGPGSHQVYTPSRSSSIAASCTCTPCVFRIGWMDCNMPGECPNIMYQKIFAPDLPPPRQRHVERTPHELRGNRTLGGRHVVSYKVALPPRSCGAPRLASGMTRRIEQA